MSVGAANGRKLDCLDRSNDAIWVRGGCPWEGGKAHGTGDFACEIGGRWKYPLCGMWISLVSVEIHRSTEVTQALQHYTLRTDGVRAVSTRTLFQRTKPLV